MDDSSHIARPPVVLFVSGTLETSCLRIALACLWQESAFEYFMLLYSEAVKSSFPAILFARVQKNIKENSGCFEWLFLFDWIQENQNWWDAYVWEREKEKEKMRTKRSELAKQKVCHDGAMLDASNLQFAPTAQLRKGIRESFIYNLLEILGISNEMLQCCPTASNKSDSFFLARRIGLAWHYWEVLRCFLLLCLQWRNPSQSTTLIQRNIFLS